MQALWIREWPLIVGALFMVVVGLRTYLQLKIPNWLILCGVFSAVVCCGVVSDPLPTVITTLGTAALGLALLIPFFISNNLRGGCVKSHAVLGAWMGLGMKLHGGGAPALLSIATVVGILLTGISVYFARRRSLARGLEFIESHDHGAEAEVVASHELFPAQTTMSLSAVLTICWSISQRM